MAKGTAIVTGCAAKGIGRAIAIRLASDGFDVVLNDLPSRKADLEALSKEIQEQSPGRKTLVCAGDVSSDEFVKGMVDQTVEVYGGLDVMVANAGVCPVQSLLEGIHTPMKCFLSLIIIVLSLCCRIRQNHWHQLEGGVSLLSKRCSCNDCTR